ncbi:MAG: hypothetical protein GY731_19300 [Gammaproteobacteria bacterium]|nr:hypothetical protein [Gammaproteobacteria bacterium]
MTKTRYLFGLPMTHKNNHLRRVDKERSDASTTFMVDALRLSTLHN